MCLLFQLDCTNLINELRKLDRFVDPYSVRYLMCFCYQFIQVLVSYYLVVLKAAEYCILTSEAVEAAAENVFVKELVLTEEVKRAVRDRCSGKYEVV